MANPRIKYNTFIIMSQMEEKLGRLLKGKKNRNERILKFVNKGVIQFMAKPHLMSSQHISERGENEIRDSTISKIE